MQLEHQPPSGGNRHMGLFSQSLQKTCLIKKFFPVFSLLLASFLQKCHSDFWPNQGILNLASCWAPECHQCHLPISDLTWVWFQVSVAEQVSGGFCWWHSFAGHDSVLAQLYLQVPWIQDIMPALINMARQPTPQNSVLCLLLPASSFLCLPSTSFQPGIVPTW